jgi:O-antigen/teichoic acid export membrane protein
MPAVTEPSTDDERKAERAADSKAAGIFVYSKTAAGLLYIVTTAVGTRVYDKEGFNYVTAVTLLHLTAVALGSLGLADAVFYFLGRAPDRAAAIVRQTSLLLLIAAVPVIAVVIGAGFVMSDSQLRLIPALPWIALMLFMELPTQPAVNQLLAGGHAVKASVLFVGFEAARVAAVLLPAFTGLPLTVIPVAMAATGLIRLVAHLWILRRYYPLADGERWSSRREMWTIFAFALPAGLASMVGKLNPQIDKYVVEAFYPDLLGLYGAAAIEIPLITAIPYAIGAVMQVRYVRLYATEQTVRLRELWHQTAEKTALIVVPLTTIIMVVADELIVLIASQTYAAAATPFRIFTFVLFHRVAAYGPMLQAVGRIRLLLVTSTLILVSNLLLTVPLTWLLGYNGAAIATTVANVPAWIVSLHFIGMAWGRGIPDALPWRFYGKVLVLSWLVGVAVYVAGQFVGGPPVLRIVGATVVYGAVFLVAGRITGLVRREDLAFLRRWISFGAIK